MLGAALAATASGIGSLKLALKCPQVVPLATSPGHTLNYQRVAQERAVQPVDEEPGCVWGLLRHSLHHSHRIYRRQHSIDSMAEHSIDSMAMIDVHVGGFPGY